MYIQKVISFLRDPKSFLNNVFSHFLKMRPAESVFSLVTLILAVRLLARCLQGLGNLDTNAFTNSELWQSLAIVITVHAVLIACSILFARSWPMFGVAVFYVAMLLSFPFLWTLNALSLRLPDTVFLITVIMLWLALIFVRCKMSSNHSEIKAPSLPFWTMPNCLIMLWFIHAVILFLGFNFTSEREPFADETTLWYTASERMVLEGYTNSHVSNYDGRGIQPLGTSFVAALPAKVFGSLDTASIYFMPIVVIVILGMVFLSMRGDRWAMFFLIVAVFATFHNRSWMSELSYKLVYGEGLSMVFFLAVTQQLYCLEKTVSLSTGKFIFLCSLIGLLGLVKWPLTLIVPVFFVVAVLNYLSNLKFSRNWIVVAAGFVAAMFPQLLWYYFNSSHGFSTPGLSVSAQEMMARLSNPNIPALKLILGDIYTQFDSFFYYGVLSFVLTGLVWQRKEYVRLVPILFLGFAVTFFYAYIFIYRTTEGDWASALRYYMPGVCALYFWGALCLSRLIKKIDELRCSYAVRFMLCLGVAGVCLVKMF